MVQIETEYTKQALDFLEKTNATCEIEFEGCTRNLDWKDKEKRNFYNVILTTPRGSMNLTFWDSIYNTEISKMTIEKYAKKRFGCKYPYLLHSDKVKARRELKEKQAVAFPTAYDILACVTKYDPGTFEDFCSEFGYDEDSKMADKIYTAAMREYKQLERIFTHEQIEELQEIW